MTQTIAPRRVTPTGVQLLRFDAPRGEWLAKRREGIGSSDIAKIVGVADRQNQPAFVWHDKRGTPIEEEPGDPAIFGNLFEAPIAGEWCRRNRSVIRNVGLVTNVDEPWMLCTLDRLIRECPLDREQKARCALEVKTRTVFKAAKWHKQIPDDVAAQAHWQRLVTGLDHIHVCVVIGGNDYRQAVVHANRDVESYLADMARNFWQHNVLGGVEPAWNHDVDHPEDLVDLDRRLHGVDRVGELSVADIGEVMEYAELSAAEGRAKRAREQAKTRLLELANGNRYVKFADELAFSVEPRSRANCNFERLAEKYPDVYADPEIVTETSFTAIQIAKAYRRTKS